MSGVVRATMEIRVKALTPGDYVCIDGYTGTVDRIEAVETDRVIIHLMGRKFFWRDVLDKVELVRRANR